MIVNVANVAKQAIPQETKEPVGIHETIKDKLFNVTPEVITALSKEVTPIYAQATQTSAIEKASEELNANSNLSIALNNFSNKSLVDSRLLFFAKVI